MFITSLYQIVYADLLFNPAELKGKGITFFRDLFPFKFKAAQRFLQQIIFLCNEDWWLRLTVYP